MQEGGQLLGGEGGLLNLLARLQVIVELAGGIDLAVAEGDGAGAIPLPRG